jgi:hypothetical protein
LFKTEVDLNQNIFKSSPKADKKIYHLPEIKIKEVKSEILPNIHPAYSKDNILQYLSAYMKVKPPFKFKK